MSINLYLAMTAAEFSNQKALPPKIGWMACHFSCYSSGLTNLPADLPPGSMVILNDYTPPHGHDAGKIVQQLTELIQRLSVSKVLLDFQRGGCEETYSIARALVQALGCPVGVSDLYAEDLSCPVFLPPPPLHKPLKDYLLPWKGREIWLEAATAQEILTLTEKGCQIDTCQAAEDFEPKFTEQKLHCQYCTQIKDDCVIFTLQRNRDDLDRLLQEAQELGVTTSIGLYQQLKAPGD